MLRGSGEGDGEGQWWEVLKVVLHTVMLKSEKVKKYVGLKLSGMLRKVLSTPLS